MKNFIKNNIKLVIGIIIGAIISGTSVYGATLLFNSNQVGFDNTTAELTLNSQPVDNVQDAIDSIFTKVNTQLNTCNTNYSTCSSSLSTCQIDLANAPIAKNNIVYYAFGTPTTSSTTDYTTLNKRVFVALNGSQMSVCIIRYNRLHCFDENNWPIEKDHIQYVFGDTVCDVDQYSVSCNAYAGDFNCSVDVNGGVFCREYSTTEAIILWNGSVKLD